MNDDQKLILKDAIDTWGRDAQIQMIYEEVGELLSVIGKFYRGRKTEEDVIDEIADCLIMLNQAAMMFGETKVSDQINFKLDRLKSTLNKIKTTERNTK
jgi:NTP pyrophosphatase (non-canonical NTP hydrolase)